MFERFTDRARRVLVLAQQEAALLNHTFIGTEHILLGLIHEGEGVAAKALDRLGIKLDAVRERVEETVGLSGAAPTASPPFTPRAKKVLELALREALQLGHNYIGTEHILLGIVREGQGVGAQVLVSMGADLAVVREQVISLLSGYAPEGASTRTGFGTAEGFSPPFGVLVCCSFCGAGPREAGELIAGARRAYVCQRCVAFWAARLREPEAMDPDVTEGEGDVIIRAAGSYAATQLAASAGAMETGGATVEIGQAFAAVLQTDADAWSVPAVDHGDTLGPVVARLRADGLRPDELTVRVTQVRHKSAHRARVEFAYTSPALGLDAAVVGAAVLVDGSWKVDIETFNTVVAALRGHIVPPPAAAQE